MSIYYRDKNGARRVVAGMTPGGDLAMGASTMRNGVIDCPASSTQSYSQQTVSFVDPMPDGDYIVEIQPASGDWEVEQWTCVNKAASGFTFVVHNINHTAPFVATKFYYKAFKLYEVSEAEENASDITTIKSYIPATTSSSNKLVNANELTAELGNVDLDDLHDVDLSSLSDGQTIIWDDTNSKWVNGQGGKTYSAGDGVSIDGTNKISANTDGLSVVIGNNKELRVAETYKTTFIGTTAEWEALSVTDKAKYSLVSLTDDSNGTSVVDAVTNGDMRPITSNAVYDELNFNYTNSQLIYQDSIGAGGTLTYTIPSNGTYQFRLQNNTVAASKGSSLIINGITVGSIRHDVLYTTVWYISRLSAGATITCASPSGGGDIGLYVYIVS